MPQFRTGIFIPPPVPREKNLAPAGAPPAGAGRACGCEASRKGLPGASARSGGTGPEAGLRSSPQGLFRPRMRECAGGGSPSRFFSYLAALSGPIRARSRAEMRHPGTFGAASGREPLPGPGGEPLPGNTMDEFTEMIACTIFDLDGVLVDTARYHYLAWAELARTLGFAFTPSEGEAVKGVSRMAALDIVLRAGGLEGRFTPEEKTRLAAEKNARYLALVAGMTASEVLPGVAPFLRELRGRGVKVALGSASKNAGVVLDRCGLRSLFDAVADGTLVTKAKPDPEVFLRGAELAGEAPARCVVFEDAAAGIEAAARAGMRSVGVGDSPALAAASMRIAGFEGFTFAELAEAIDRPGASGAGTRT